MEGSEFRSLRVSLASPEQIRSWSYGEVTKPETINYRRLRPEKDGLFCEAIFGPQKDWQCYCGKYKNVRYKGIVCDKCGVEITRSSVRRERLGHIELAAPVAHVWYTRRVPSYMGLLLNISRRNLDRVLYFAQYVITSVDDDARERAIKRLDEELLAAELRLELELQSQVENANEGASGRLAGLVEELDTLNSKFDDLLAESTDALMGEAKSVNQRLENWKGSAAEENITYKGTDIVTVGEVVGLEHETLVGQVTKEELGKIEEASQAEREKKFADLSREIGGLRDETSAVSDEVGGLYGQKLEQLRTQAQTNRDMLEGLVEIQFLNENEYRDMKSKFGNVFRAAMGAEAFYEILSNMDLDKLARDLWREVRTTRSKQASKRATKRLKVVENLRQSGNRPEWMILTVLPVIPPDLRPMVQLDGGRFATSDLNDLYRRVINRNNRLKRLLELGAPDVIVRNEKRMLQEAVDSLIDNSQRGKALSRRGRRELKSLSDMLKGKKGRFRRNLLGKRVDYSGRSVIVVGAKLRMGECGLPKVMALELFRPFVISKLIKYGHASNVKGARRVIERQPPEVWEVLEEVIVDRPILLNRAPTLHRLGIQAFMPKLVEGKAINLHPLVCSAFNADFDGDQMAVHVPLSDKAVAEAKSLMLSTKNLLKPADGKPIVGPSKDMVMGVYYITVAVDGMPGEGKLYTSMMEVERAFDLGHVHIHAKIKLYTETYFDDDNKRYADNQPIKRVIETTPGRVLFNNVMPENMRFINYVLDKGDVNEVVNRVHRRCGPEITINLVDDIKDIGFRYATYSGVTIAVADLTVPEERAPILKDARANVDEIDRQYRRGLLTSEEQYTRTVDTWLKAKEAVEKAVRSGIDPSGPVAMMAISGSTKGGFGPITDLAGMRGLMADPQGRIIEVPITSNFRMGLTAQEYFISTHGSRKGLADTALRTADAGYLTRRLVDVAQDQIVLEDDCGTERGIYMRRKENFGKQKLSERLYGRHAAQNIVNPETGEIMVAIGEIIEEEIAAEIDDMPLDDIYVRSPMTCELRRGVCAMCYGADMATGVIVAKGTAVGIIAAQSIGEPGTQLTLRTFHTGGTASSGGDITQGLPRVEELFEARQTPKGECVMTEIGGIVSIEVIDGVRHVIVTDRKLVDEVYEVPADWKIKIKNGQAVEVGDMMAEGGDDEIIAARQTGHVEKIDGGIKLTYESIVTGDEEIPAGMRLIVAEGDEIEAGDQLTEGSKNPHRILQIQGRDAVTAYLLRETQQVYRPQGQNIADKHFEVIIRKMLGKVIITQSGDTDMLPGNLIDAVHFQDANNEVIEEGGQPAAAEPVIMGITKASLSTDSFLSASSFQHTIKVLAGAAIAGQKDDLVGLKENVIIGKLIPAGTGFDKYMLPEAEPVTEESGLIDDEFSAVDMLDDFSEVSISAGNGSTLIDDNTSDEELEKALAAALEAKSTIELPKLVEDQELPSRVEDRPEGDI